MISKIRSLVLLFFAFVQVAFLQVKAEEVTFIAQAEKVVAMGGRFLLSYTLNNADGDNIQMPTIENFEILSGPSQSRSTSMSIINGARTMNSSVKYSYVLTPKSEGTFTIPPAKVTVNGQVIRSNALTIKVVKEQQQQTQSQSQSGNSQTPQGHAKALSDEDVFIKTEISKKKVYEQEQLVATIKMYYNVNVNSISDVKLPDYKGFVVNDIDIPDDQKNGRESVNGKIYNTYIIKQSVLIPQKPGTLTIDKGNATIIATVQVTSAGGGFFGGYFSRPVQTQKSVSIPGASITVDALPTKGKPENFSGAVGSFTMTSSITPTENYKTNEGITIKVKISGTGNIKYVKNPELKFPNDFEIYDPKVDSKIKVTANGTTGSKDIEYLTIARYPGQYEIPEAEFTYFDLKSKTYKTLKTQKFVLDVEKGAGSDESTVVSNFTTKENVKFVGSGDIRFINTKDLKVTPKDDFLYGTTLYWMLIFVPILLFVASYFFLRKLAEDNKNIVLVRNKKANKQATKRLNSAKKFMDADNKSSFYEETLKAMWGYVSDKLNIPLTKLTKDNIESELKSKSVTEETVKQFMSLLDTCEFARFAPTAAGQTMQDVYNSTIEIIDKLESEIKK